MEGKSIVDTIKFEDGKQNLSEAQEAAIVAEALKEINGEKESKDADTWVNPADEELKAQEAEAKEKEEADAQAAADAEAKEKTEQEAREKQEADEKLKAQETEEQTKARIAKQEADKVAAAGGKSGTDFKIAEADRAKAIEELALKESLTLKEAEEQISKDEALVNKYKQNPLEMAKALRHIQQEASKAKAELEATRKAAGKPPAPVMNNVREYVNQQIEPIKDKLIPQYKKEYPELCEGQSDEFIYGLIKKDAIDRTSKILEENESKIVSAAKEKRAELIMGLAEVDKAFLPDIKAQLERCAPRQILDKNFLFQDLVDWARGRQLDRLLKEAEERGFKRGQEGAKIMGEKTPGAGNKQAGSSTAKKTAGGRLSDEQKERAINMFDGAEGMDDEAKFAAYIDTYPEEFQK